MKIFYITNNNDALIVDSETNNAKSAKSLPDRVSRMYVAEDNLEIRYQGDKSKQTVLKAQKGDLIFTFYGDDRTPIVVKNADWKHKVATELANRDAENAKYAKLASLSDCEDCCCKCESCC